MRLTKGEMELYNPMPPEKMLLGFYYGFEDLARRMFPVFPESKRSKRKRVKR